MISTLRNFLKNLRLLLPVVLILLNAADCAGGGSDGLQLPFLQNRATGDKQIHSLGVKKDVESPKTVVANNLAAVQKNHKNQSLSRFVDNGDGTVTDRKTNLMWIKNGRRLEFVSAVTWWDAVNKSNDIKIGGYDNWRLPTIYEWSTLIDTDYQYPALVEPNPFENIVTHMPYWSITEFTYGKDHTCSKKCPLDAYTVIMYSGRIHHQKKSYRAFIMPVRSLDVP